MAFWAILCSIVKKVVESGWKWYKITYVCLGGAGVSRDSKDNHYVYDFLHE